MTVRPALAEQLDLAPHPEGGWYRQIGMDLDAGQRPQLLVPGGVWQSAEPAGDAPVLVSCVVSPGFEVADFRLHGSSRV
jgi:predicted cupin superfamily sugar epimerase